MIAEKGGIIMLKVPAEPQLLRTAKAVIEAILCHERLDKRRLSSTINALMLALKFNLKSLNYSLGHIENDDIWASRQDPSNMRSSLGGCCSEKKSSSHFLLNLNLVLILNNLIIGVILPVGGAFPGIVIRVQICQWIVP